MILNATFAEPVLSRDPEAEDVDAAFFVSVTSCEASFWIIRAWLIAVTPPWKVFRSFWSFVMSFERVVREERMEFASRGMRETAEPTTSNRGARVLRSMLSFVMNVK